MILKRREEIADIKDHWKEKLALSPQQQYMQEFHATLASGTLTPAKQGCGAAYFLYDALNNPKYVIKPFDEDILCLNNRKEFASPYYSRVFRVRDQIPLYRSAQAEALSYAIAKLLDLEDLTPRTHMAIITHEDFHDISDEALVKTSLNCYEDLGKPVREKLCSIQTYIPHMRTLYSLVEEWLADNLPEKEILYQIEQENFENLFLLIWLLYDTDAHAGNLYVTEINKEKYRLLKIDNGLTFPEKNSHLLNALYFFPHAKIPPSKHLQKLVQNLPIEKMKEKICYFELDQALDAFEERVYVLQQLVKKGTLSLREIDMRLRALELPEGEKLALSEISLKKLKNMVSY